MGVLKIKKNQIQILCASLFVLVPVLFFNACTNKFQGLSPSSNILTSASQGGNLPLDSREITFPLDMNAAGWLDVTHGGASIGCPDALANLSDASSVSQTTKAIQCRLNAMGIGANPGALYFPAGTYSINAQLSLTAGYPQQNADGTYSYIPYGGGDRSGWTGLVHLLGRSPDSTKIVWAGPCGYDPNIADPVHIKKFNTMLYVSGMSPLVIERLTFDGNNCAGTGLEMVSKPNNMSGVQLHELTFQNLKEVGIVGDRPSLTNDEMHVGDNTGMVSEVTMSRLSFLNINYAGIMINAANALDYWISDSLFENCGIGVTNTNSGVQQLPGVPGLAALNWGPDGAGNFSVSNSIFKNNHAADINLGNWSRIGLRNNFSSGGAGPFVQSVTFLGSTFYLQGNTIAPQAGIVPILMAESQNYLVAFQNKFITSAGTPGISVWTTQYGGYPAQIPGASPSIGNLFNLAYSNVTSVANQYSSTAPYSTYSGPGTQSASRGIYTLATAPGWAPVAAMEPFQCAMGNNFSALQDQRTFCKSYSLINAYQDPVYNLVSTDDQLGVGLIPVEPTLPPIRPEVTRDSITVSIQQVNTAAASIANADTIQSAVNMLAAKQKKCTVGDYYCFERLSTVFIPSGSYPIGHTILIPGTIQIKIVGAQTLLYWYWYGTDIAGNPAGATPIFKLLAPSHVILQDLILAGSNDVHFSDNLGEGIVAEVTDLPGSRIFSEALSLWGSFSVNKIGDANFQMKSFQNGATSSITGNNGTNAGMFSYFGGNPLDVFVGGGANLMVQDTWYEGSDSRFITCNPNDSANIAIENSTITMGGWHGVSPSSQTTLNVDTCSTQTTVVGSDLGRQGWSGLAPTQSLILPATATAKTKVLLIGNNSLNSDFGNSEDLITADFTGAIDQGFLKVDPGAQALYANVQGTFSQRYNNYTTETGSQTHFPAKETGVITKDFLRSGLSQVLNPLHRAPASVLAPITDAATTDIQIYNVRIWGTRKDVQFILPGGAAQ